MLVVKVKRELNILNENEIIFKLIRKMGIKSILVK